MSVHFPYFLNLNEVELIQQVGLMKYIENEISNSTSHKTKSKSVERKHNSASKPSFLKLLKNYH